MFSRDEREQTSGFNKTTSNSVYNFTISLLDEYDYMTSDTVFVIVVDTTAPEIDSPSGLIYEEGAVGNTITWVPSDLDPASYEVFRNGTSIESGPWDGSSITINVDGRSAGIYLYSISVMDSSGNGVSDTVTVFVIAADIVTDTISPEMDSPLGVIYNETATGNIIKWDPFDLHPESYEIFRNGSSIESGTWNGSTITINVDGLSAGIYNYTLVVLDSSGNMASDNVMVVVLAVPSTTTSTTTDTTTLPSNNIMLIIGLSGAGVAIVVILLVLRRRP